MTDRNKAEELADAFKYLTKNEVGAIKTYARMCGANPIIVNIGAGAGTSALAIYEARVDEGEFHLTTVDISRGGPLGGMSSERNAFLTAGYDWFPEQLLGASHEIGKAWPESRKIDMLFIDDGHLEHEIRGDIEAWIEHMRVSGYVLFHDYGSKEWPDVKMVVDEVMPRYGIPLARFDTIMVYEII